MTLSEKILHLRKQNGLSQEAFAEKLGVSRQSVSKWESGAAVPEIDKIIAISEIFGVSTDELLKSDSLPEREQPVSDIDDTQEIILPEEQQNAPAQPTLPPEEPKKSSKKIVIAAVAVVLALCIAATAITIPLYIKYKKEKEELPPIDYPYVLVHGLGGYGDDGDLSEIAHYWGGETGSLVEYLTGEGYEVYAPSIGPISSAWDRACELYALLTGTTVDYGEAHSAEHKHERYGRTYGEPLFENWGGKKDGQTLKVNLVGHSFGGPTIRLLTALLEYGSEAEIKASGEDVSPLFEGGKGKWVNSVIALCAPHNGSSLATVADSVIGKIGIENAAQYISTMAFDIIGTVSSKNGLYDLMLDHFKIDEVNDENKEDIVLSFISMGTDHAIYDLAPDGAAELNNVATTVKGVYYFSYAYSTTKDVGFGGHLPTDSTMAILSPLATLMGSFKGTTAGGIEIDETWQENDGLVNVVSAKYPFGQEHTDLPENTDEIKKGIWNVAPVSDGDHGRVIGLGATAKEVRTFFTGLFEMIDSLKR